MSAPRLDSRVSLTRTATAVVVATMLVAAHASTRGDQDAEPPTFHAAVAPIIAAKCTPCHQAEGDAPFPLETYAQVRDRASLIVRVTASGYMPPWKPSSDSPAFVGERRLSAEERAVIARWVAAGRPEGVRPTGPAPQRPASVWAWGEPDAIIPLPEYVLPAAGADVFRNFVVRVPFVGTRHVQGVQFRPRSAAVHHANIRVDPTTASEQLDLEDPAPGYEGVILHSAEYPAGHFLGWTPGQAAPPAKELSWPLTGGTFFVVQLHMQSTGRPERIRPLLGLYFAAAPAGTAATMIRLGRQDLKIRAGDDRFASTDSFVTPVPINVTAIQPHAHQRARRVSLVARRPDGSRQTLLRIADWDFRWQDRYHLAKPIRLPAGTTLESQFVFDNSATNPRNPITPVKDVTWGWRTSDEMADVWVQVLTDSNSDGRRLMQLARQKATTEDAIGTEILLAREPSHFHLRNDAALIYMELRQPARALEHFAASRRLQPAMPATAFNVGTALDALGRLEEAAAAYRDAIALDTTYVPARLRLAALRYRQGALHHAVTLYEEALRLSPANSGARCDLARLLVESGRPSQAVEHYRTALQNEPRNVACLINFTWLLAAHDDAAVRDAQHAVALGERAVDAGSGYDTEPLALDALAAAYASAGRFQEAITTVGRALTLFADERQRQAAQERLARYQRGLPFRVPGSRQK